MRDPVLLQDGFSYEREAISKWFLTGRKSSPITNEALSCVEIFPNRALKTAIAGFMAQQKVALKEMLLRDLARIETNRELAHDDPLLRCCFVNLADNVIDTYHLLLAVLLSWKADAEVCTAALQALLRIVKQDPEDARRMAFLDFFPTVMDATSRFDRLSVVQALGLRFVQAFCRMPMIRTGGSMQRLRATDMVLLAMRTYPTDRPVQLEGARAIQALGASFPANVFKSGAARVLVQAAAHFTDDAEVMLALCLAVGSLTTACCARLCPMGFCRKVADAMVLFPGDQGLQLQGCLALGRLCHSKLHCDEAACDAVVACLQEHGAADAKVRLAGCWAVARVAQWPRFAGRVGELGGCETVMGLLLLIVKNQLEEDPELAAAVAAALEVLTNEAEEESNNRARLATAAFREGVLVLLERHVDHRRTVLSCIKSIHRLSLFSTDFALAMEAEQGASRQIIRAMRRHLAEEDIQEYGWLCLDRLLPSLAAASVVPMAVSPAVPPPVAVARR